MNPKFNYNKIGGVSKKQKKKFKNKSVKTIKKNEGGMYIPPRLEKDRNLARTISKGANLQIDLIKLCPYIDKWFEENSQYLYDFIQFQGHCIKSLFVCLDYQIKKGERKRLGFETKV